MGGKSLSVELDTLELKVQSNADQAALKVDKLTSALNNLKSITKGGVGLTTVANQLSKLNGALSGLTVDNKKLTSLSTALNSLSSVQKASGFSSTVNALKNLSNVSKELSKTDLSKFASQMNQVANAIRPLATEMEKVSAGFKAFPIRIQKLISSNTGLAASNKTAGNSFGFLGVGISGVIAKIGIYGYTLKRTVGSWITSYNDYVENVNLFTVAMGKFADESMEYAERVQSAMGIDLSEWIRNQSVLMDMVKGYGVVEDKAKTMSEGLTQLIYDYASFYNIGIEESAQKVQSAIAGEIEPVRRLGKDLSVATLQQYAYKYGIDQSVNSMTQAQKAQLRYVALMDQSKSAMGDMARTIQTPANAMRILQQQVQQLTRALGSLFIPILQVVIPWVQAFVSVLTDAARAIAGFFGVELPTIDYSGMDNIGTSAGVATDEIEDTTGALGDAAAAAKKLKDYTLGFDELNILNPDTGTASGGSGGSGGASGGSYGGDLGLPIESYNFLDGLNEQANSLKKTIESILPIVAAIGAGILAWKLSRNFTENLKSLKKLAGFTAISIGVALELENINNIFSGEYDNVSLESAANSMISGAMIGVGAILLGAAGWVLPVAIALMPVVTEIATNWDSIKQVGSLNWEGVQSLFSGDMQSAGDSFAQSMATQLESDSWGVAIAEAILGEDAVAAAAELFRKKGGQAFSDAWNWGLESVKTTISNKWNEITAFFSEKVPEVINGIVDWFKGLPNKIGEAIGFVIGKLSAWKDNVCKWVSEKVPEIINSVVGWFRDLPNKIKQKLDEFRNTIIQWKNNAIKWFNEELPKILNNIVDWFKGLPDSLVTAGKNMIYGLWNGIMSVGTWLRDKLSGFFGGLWDSVKGFFSGFSSGYTKGYESVPTFASGGFPTPGQLFVANEPGNPEMVGSIGGRTAVANNDQITQGIAQAVYQAFVAAQNEGSQQPIDLTVTTMLDGRTVYRNQERVRQGMGYRMTTSTIPV